MRGCGKKKMRRRGKKNTRVRAEVSVETDHKSAAEKLAAVWQAGASDWHERFTLFGTPLLLLLLLRNLIVFAQS